MHESGLPEIFSFICISALWGQILLFGCSHPNSSLILRRRVWGTASVLLTSPSSSALVGRNAGLPKSQYGFYLSLEICIWKSGIPNGCAVACLLESRRCFILQKFLFYTPILGLKKKKIHLLFFSLNEVKSGFSLIIFSLQDEHFLLEAHCHFVNTWIFSL